MSKVILCDIDGTLADPKHRLGFVRTKPKNWKAFFELSEHDPPHDDIVWLVKTLKAVGCTILIVTARNEDERERTVKWLHEKAGLEGVYERLYMREAKDYRDDSVVKKEILDKIRSDGYNPEIVLDDRNGVVAMWREAGLRCLQVQPGDF